MPITEQADAVAAEGIASSTEHVEQVTSVEPWALRRDSNASWAAISSPRGRSSIRGPICSTIASAGSHNPFSDAFGASLVANSVHRHRDTSEASSSTAVGSSEAERDAQVVNGKSELTRTIEEVDGQTEEIQRILDGDAIAASNDEAERRRYAEARAERPPRRGSRWSRPLASLAVLRRQRSTRSSIDTERQYAHGLHQLHADNCQACRQNSSVAMAGIYMLAITTVVAIPSPFILIKVLPDKSSPSSQLNLYLVMALPSAIFNSLLMIAWVVLAGLRWPAWREKSRVGFVKQWLVSLTVGLGLYFLVAGVLYAFSK
ncbi:hypothetical protein A1O7_09841 [Cladophialophora yegresii CBS 114405]|uniref:Uncharacterized protein n=1 Tax=Cladophialophora yegresii CBS 114405 TaxID=1182544 RepID=W9VQR8_9EURO|nr:uncharacterized protein A1O7_09841 [Cladophialophora yegresii CBS 114405]EXJ54501.1 hypothetical protein A1O7_09841 [Cladophialophora yegresii CBS 114405]